MNSRLIRANNHQIICTFYSLQRMCKKWRDESKKKFSRTSDKLFFGIRRDFVATRRKYKIRTQTKTHTHRKRGGRKYSPSSIGDNSQGNSQRKREESTCVYLCIDSLLFHTLCYLLGKETFGQTNNNNNSSNMPQHHRPIGIVQLVFISLLVWMLIDCGNSEVQRHGLFEWKPCPESCTLEMLSRKGHTDKSDGARAFYLILIHNERTQNDAIHLFRAIRDPRNIIFIHYDTAAEHLMKQTSSKNVLLQEIETCPCGAIIRLESVYTVEWSKWSMNLPTLYGMQVAVEEYQDQWDVFINLSGDTLPIYSQDTMAKMLYQLSDYNFVASRSCETDLLPTSVNYFPSFWHKRRHYTNDEKESDPTFFYSNGSETKNMTVTVHFGSQWVILQHSFCHWLIHELRDPQSWPSQLQNHLRESGKLMTDETCTFRNFFPNQTQLIHCTY